MPTKPTTPTKEPEKPKQPTNWPAAFRDWAAGRTGLTNEELVDVFATGYYLTPAERKTLEGVLKTEPLKPPTPRPPAALAPPAPKQPTVKPDLIIGRTPYPKWWKDSLNAKIEFQAPGSQVLATVSGNLRLYVSTIVITVTNTVWIYIGFGDSGESGTIYLGGLEQPKGMVIAMGNSPAPCGRGNLVIRAEDPDGLTPWVGGFATCFAVQEKEPRGELINAVERNRQPGRK